VGAFQLRVYVSPQGPVGVAGRPIAPVGDAPLGDLEGAAGGDPQGERVDLGEDGADGLGPGEPVALMRAWTASTMICRKGQFHFAGERLGRGVEAHR
jgi:hypothetical protein